MNQYGALMRTERMARLYAAMIIARMPIGINGIAVVLFLRHEGRSFALAGAVAGAMALGSGLGAPVAARLIDRLGGRVLLSLGMVHAAGLVAVIALGVAGARALLLVPVSFVVGAALPPISSVLRNAYKSLLAHDQKLIPTAFALEAIIVELVFFAGPLLTAALVLTVSASAALVVSAVSVVAGTAWFLAELPAGLAEPRAADVKPNHWAGALRSPGLRTIVLSMLPVGFAFGAIEVALPAFADAQGERGIAGVLIAIWSIGSAVGGILYGARPRMLPLTSMHMWAAAMVPIGMASLVLAESPVAMGFLVILAGFPIAPLIATRNELAGVVALPGSETEAFTWPLTALVSGVALGAATAGALADGPGWRAAVAAAVLASVIGALVTVVRRGTLQPQPAVAAI